jgi:DNA helicase II / ATP-dependent DNA helicase PcrA
MPVRWNHGLTDEQIQAIEHSGNHARLLAGPGTGKTHCLTRRVAYLVRERCIPPSEILVLTFTRAAAAELKSRLNELLDDDERGVVVSTLHSYALRTLLTSRDETRLPQPLRIVDDYEERWIVREDLKRILGLGRVTMARDLLHQLSADWEQLSADAPDWESRFPNPGFLGAWREHRHVFGYCLRAEMVYQLKHALDNGELDVRPPSQVLVDEYQDLNACDLAVIKHLSEAGSQVYACGDDDQSIYGFRYGNPEGIRRFPTEYVPCEQKALCECKRCDTSILECARYVARQDPRRIDKDMYPSENAGMGEVRLLRFASQEPEATAIATISRYLIDVKRVAPENILILLRSDHQRKFSKPLALAFELAGVPIGVFVDPLEPINDRERPEGREFYALLKLIANPSDHLAWRTLLDVRRNSIGGSTLAAVYEFARSDGYSFTQALRAIESDPTRAERGTRIAEEIRNIDSTLRTWNPLSFASLSEFIAAIATELISDKSVRVSVVRLLDSIMESASCSTLDQLLRSINLSMEEKEQESEPSEVKIMTMHQAKGLSADAVFVLAAENEYIPGDAQGSELEDSRRLLYVSLTRARHYLFVTHCQQRVGAQMRSGSAPTRTTRHITPFLDGGPLRSEDGQAYLRTLGG